MLNKEKSVSQKCNEFEEFVDILLRKRKDFRQSGQFEKADELRNLLISCGIEVQDTKRKTLWRKLFGNFRGAKGEV